MIKKNLGVFKLIINLCIFWFINYILNNDKKKGRLICKEKFQVIVDEVLRKYFFNNFQINGTIKKTPNKIDLIMTNHISTIDFLIIITILYKFNIPNYYFVFKESIVKIPVLGPLMSDDIRLTRSWDKDQELILNQLKNIDYGTLVIYPEGTRYDNRKHKDALKFCYENKLPLYNYTLAPKAKGTHSIFEILSKNNKLGKIYDMTLIIPKYINKNMYLSSIFGFKELGDIQVFVKEVKFTNDELNYEKFKKKLFNIWLSKNILFDLYLKKNKYLL